MQKPSQLPDNIADLKALLSAQLVEVAALTAERDLLREEKNDDLQQIQRLALLIDKLRRMLFGRKSEKLMQQIEQLQLELEELHINQGERTQQAEAAAPDKPTRSAPNRRPLPEHLPRDTQEHLPHDASCPDCGGAWQCLGEDVSEVLEYVPSSFRVTRHVRPRLSCTGCERIEQAPAVSRPIARSYAGPGLLSRVMVSKYLDHQPLYRG